MNNKSYAWAFFAFLFLAACQAPPKTPTESTDATETDAAFSKDSLIGPAGAEKAIFTAADTFRTFEYPTYTIKVTDIEYGGERVTVTPKDGSASWSTANIEMSFFNGIVGNYLLIDEGTLDIARTMHVIDLTTHQEVGKFEYDSNNVSFENNALIYFQLEDEKNVLKKPACPEAAEWRKGGLDVGYAQKKIFDLKTAKISNLGEWMCMPLS
jgi:hypothetical protein